MGVKGRYMKTTSRNAADDLRPEYRRSDFGTPVRGKYAQRVIEATNVASPIRRSLKPFQMVVRSTRHGEGFLEIASPPLAQLPVQRGRAASGAPVNGPLDGQAIDGLPESVILRV